MKGNGAVPASQPSPQPPEPAAPRRRRWLPVVTCLMITVAIATLVLTLRSFGALQYMELKAYDLLLSRRPLDASMAGAVTVIGITEDDIVHGPPGRVHHPIYDEELAGILKQVFECNPRAVGLDIVRDRPIPDVDGADEPLKAIAETSTNLFFGIQLGPGGRVDFKAPKWADPLQTASVNFTSDPDGVVRRGTLYKGTGTDKESVPSMAFMLAYMYLDAEGKLPRPAKENPQPGEPVDMIFGETVVRDFRPNDGAYVRANSGGVEFLLDFRSHPRLFRHITARQMLAGDFRKGDFQDKVVLIGMTAESIKDHLTTPRHATTDRTPWYGVEVHAVAVEQLLRAAMKGSGPTRFWPDWGEALWTLGWALTGGALGFMFRSPWKLLPCVVAGAAGLFLIATLAFRADWWLPLVPPLAAWVFCAFAVTSYVTAREVADRAFTMKLFGAHVSPEVAHWIWEHREEFSEGRKVRTREITATLLFTDLKGFTGVSEMLTAEQVMIWLNDLMDALAECVKSNKGYLNKYMGDSIMAVFGAPIQSTTPDEFRRDAQRAVRCALAMRRTLAKLNAKWTREGLPVIGMRVGIFTGPVIAGALGKALSADDDHARLEYAVIGDTVNTASRLESFDKDLMDEDVAADNCRILIGGPTLELLDGLFRTRYIGTESLKGKGGKVAIHGVIGEADPKPAAAPEAATATSASSA